MEGGENKKKRFLPVKKDRLKAFNERRASMDGGGDAMKIVTVEEVETDYTTDGTTTKKKIDLPKKFKKDQAKTGENNYINLE